KPLAKGVEESDPRLDRQVPVDPVDGELDPDGSPGPVRELVSVQREGGGEPAGRDAFQEHAAIRFIVHVHAPPPPTDRANRPATSRNLRACPNRSPRLGTARPSHRRRAGRGVVSPRSPEPGSLVPESTTLAPD